MKTPRLAALTLTGCLLGAVAPLHAGDNGPPPGFESLFNGEDLSGWVVPEGDGGHWKVVDGVIDYDARSEAPGEKHLWTETAYGEFVLMVDWRMKRTTGRLPMPIVLQDGTTLKDADGDVIELALPSADSGIFLRGQGKSQVNIWRWPVGSGEVYGYRTDESMPPEVRSAVTPRVNADNPVGEWNTFIIVMVEDRLTVLLNGQAVIEEARLPGVPDRGPIALQHHGGYRDGHYLPASSVMQFRNIYIRELD